VHEPFPDGWGIDDPVWEYGAPVSALTLNDNSFEVRVEPGMTAGSPAVLNFWPAIEYFAVHNRTRTIDSGQTKVRFQRLPGLRELIVTGEVSRTDPRDPYLLAVDDPALFAAMALRDALLERGVRITGGVRAVHRESPDAPVSERGVELARHTSAALAEALTVVNKVSQNLHAELVLRTVARLKNGVGSREAGLEEMEAFLTELGIKERQYNFEDASGLSRLTLLTPATVSKLLLFMHQSKHRELWLSTLPVGGEDGTLEKRFSRHRAAARIRAKTGSLSHVSSLSGYALAPGGRTLAFSIMVNNYNAPARPIRAVIDRISLALLR
jgi:D-alanyl-D-alanine carboxypeptidase/D-alanyl-D-alanine-endopeptidase (penicillin-binding protein 4)